MKTPLFTKSYKHQNILFAAVASMVFIATISLSVSRTQKIYKEFRNGKAKLATAATAQAKIINLQSGLNNLQATRIKPYQKEILLEKITSFCSRADLLVKSFPESFALKSNGCQIVSNLVEVEGNFLDMVELLYYIEEVEMLSSVSSVKFILIKDRQSRKFVLRSSIALRNLDKAIPYE